MQPIFDDYALKFFVQPETAPGALAPTNRVNPVILGLKLAFLKRDLWFHAVRTLDARGAATSPFGAKRASCLGSETLATTYRTNGQPGAPTATRVKWDLGFSNIYLCFYKFTILF